jgi:2-oxoglutarate dehydrogenase E1 component
LDREFYIDAHELHGFMQTKKTWVLRDLIKSLKTAYCRNIGVEYMHLLN